MKILLVQPPWGEVYGSYKAAARTGNAYPPLGLCYLASNLEGEHDIKIIDSEFEGLDLKSTILKIKEESFDLLCITSSTPAFYIAKKLAKGIKEWKSVPIIIGGPHVSVLLAEAMESCFDYGVYGEGEKTFSELVNAIQNKSPIKDIKGILYHDNGKVVMTEPRPFIQDIDELKFPDRSLLKLDNYRWGVPKKRIVKFTTIMTARGCPFGCIFCSQNTIFGKKVRLRSPENVLNEIEQIVKKQKIRHLAFIDDTLTLNRERMVKICEGIISKGLDITFEGWTRANTVDEELLRIMKKAGLVRISFGIESGNEDILKIIKKGVSLDELQNAYELAKKVGIETRGSVMIGNPTETKKTVMETLRFIQKLRFCDQIFINIAVPYPGTELYEMAKKGENGLRLLTDDFSEYKRYGDAVIQVNDLNQKDLIRYQKKGFKMFYLTPKRIIYNLKRAGFKSALKNSIAFFRGVF